MRASSQRLAVAATICALSLDAGALTDAWPTLETPAGARVSRVADDIVLNGKRCRVFRFAVNASENDVLAFYRRQFAASRFVENRIEGSRVIATRQGDHFHTVQLQSVDAQSVRATVITTALHDVVPSAATVDTERLLPADTAVVTTLQSTDAGRRSLLVVGLNRNSVQANREHIVAALQQRGFRLVDDGGVAAASGSHAVSLSFASPAEQAELTISDAGSHRSVLIHRTREAR